MSYNEKIIRFLKDAVSIDIGYGGFTFSAPEMLDKAQVGYSIDSRKNAITKDMAGEWKKEWIVIGLDDLVGDPIFVDTSTDHLIVMTAEQGLDEWDPYPIADSLDNFAMIINLLEALSSHRSTPEEMEKNPISNMERDEFLKAIAKQNPESEVEYWEGFLDLE